MTENCFIPWLKYKQDIHELAGKLSKQRFCGIYGIPRGGLVIAVNLTHILKLRLFSAPLAQKHGDFPLLVVDDVSDTGKTLIRLKKRLDARKIDFVVATLYRKDQTEYEPDFCVRTINQWIEFPWEV